MVVAEESHFGRAAERLHLTPSPVSRAVKELERELGAELFIRRYHQVELTPAGEQVLTRARALLADFDELRHLARAVSRRAPFTTLGQAIALARSEVGADVRIDPVGLRAGPGSAQCPDACARGTFTYAEDKDPVLRHLFYLKLAVPAGAPWDILAYQDSHLSFPSDSTLQQLYDDQEFEAYRELGYHCASAVLASICYQEDAAADAR